MALSVVDGVEFGGDAGQRVLAVAVAAAATHIADRVLDLSRGWRPVERRLRSGRIGCAGFGLALLGMAAALVVLPPLTFWIGITVCGWLGLPLAVTGFWPVVAGAFVALVGSVAVSFPVRAFTRAGRRRGWPQLSARLGICLAALWLAATLVPPVRLEPGPGWQQLLTLGVLAALFAAVEAPRQDPPATAFVPSRLPVMALYALAANTVLLWLVAWFSRAALQLPLHLDGFGALLLAGLLVTAVMWVGNLPLLLWPLARVAGSGWRAGTAVDWIAGLRPSRYGYRWAARRSGEP